MPKETFFNLNEDKKNKIYDAAVLEFSTRRFSEASINQIVKTADISRGSFYQYFEDKEDLYLYMITEIGKEKLEAIGLDGALQSDAGFFDSYMQMLKIGLSWAQKKPDYTRIGMLMELDDSNFIKKFRAMAAEGFKLLKELIIRDQKRGLIQPEADPDLIIDIIYTLNMHFLKDYLADDVYDISGMEQKASSILTIIQEGVATK
jgi:AcrR family transcriptional regulator